MEARCIWTYWCSMAACGCCWHHLPCVFTCRPSDLFFNGSPLTLKASKQKSVVKVKRCERPSDFEVSGHSLRVGAAQDLLIKGYDLAAIMRAGGWSNAETVSRYLRFSQHNIWLNVQHRNNLHLQSKSLI